GPPSFSEESLDAEPSRHHPLHGSRVHVPSRERSRQALGSEQARPRERALILDQGHEHAVLRHGGDRASPEVPVTRRQGKVGGVHRGTGAGQQEHLALPSGGNVHADAVTAEPHRVTATPRPRPPRPSPSATRLSRLGKAGPTGGAVGPAIREPRKSEPGATGAPTALEPGRTCPPRGRPTEANPGAPPTPARSTRPRWTRWSRRRLLAGSRTPRRTPSRGTGAATAR